VQEVTLATPSRKKSSVKQKRNGMQFWRVEKLAQIHKYTCCKSNCYFKTKGNVISAGYDTNQTIWMGYNFSILNIKKVIKCIFILPYIYKVLIYNILQ
jgi:hypothetical protein